MKSEKRAKLKHGVDRKVPILGGAQGLAPLLSAVVLLALVAYRGSLPAATPAPPRVEFTNVTENAGIHFLHFKGNDGTSTILEEAGPGVCAAFADFDNDGAVDVLVANNGDPPLLLHNSGMKKNHFIDFKLVGTRSNRDAIGARLKLTAAGVTQIAEVEAGGSYLSQSDLRVNFGLGPARRVERVEVAWPSGLRQVFRNLPSDKFYRIGEGNPRADFQKFFPHRIEAR